MRKRALFPIIAVIAMNMICLFGFAAKASANPTPGESSRPVVTLQKFIWAISQAAFRVQVYPDRSVIYEGSVGVRVKGEHRYQLSPGEYQALMRAIHDYATDTIQPDIFHHDAAAAITVASGGVQRSFYVNSLTGSRHILFMRNVETLLRIKSLRCGVFISVENRTRDVCEVEKDLEDSWLK